MLPGNDEVRVQLNEGLFVLQDLLDGIIECLAEKLDGLKVGLEEVRRRLEFVATLQILEWCSEKLRMMRVSRR